MVGVFPCVFDVLQLFSDVLFYLFFGTYNGSVETTRFLFLSK